MSLIVHGARCCWWDSIDKCGKTPPKGNPLHSLPCCPHCGSVLFQVEESDWWDSVDSYEKRGNKDYRKMIEWSRGKCFKSSETLRKAYELRPANDH
jgi:hypothetical protein